MGRKVEFGTQFLGATEDQVRKMISFLDAYPYTDGQVFMYLTWVLAKDTDTPVDFVMRNMEYVGMSNARANRGI